MTAMQGHKHLKAGTLTQTMLGEDVTTLMLRRVPRKYSAWDVLAELEHHVSRSALKFVYVPWENNSASNMGFAFVDFVDVGTAHLAFGLMDGTLWRNAIKPRETWIVPALVQGLDANIKRYHEATAGLSNLKHVPLVFRNGKQVPLPSQGALSTPQAPAGSERQISCQDDSGMDGHQGGTRARTPLACKQAKAPLSASSWSTDATASGSACSADRGSDILAGQQIDDMSSGSCPFFEPLQDLAGPGALRFGVDELVEGKYHWPAEPVLTCMSDPDHFAARGAVQTASQRPSEITEVLMSPGYARAWHKVNNLLSELSAVRPQSERAA
jgi:hypothetical protein